MYGKTKTIIFLKAVLLLLAAVSCDYYSADDGFCAAPESRELSIGSDRGPGGAETLFHNDAAADMKLLLNKSRRKDPYLTAVEFHSHELLTLPGEHIEDSLSITCSGKKTCNNKSPPHTCR